MSRKRALALSLCSFCVVTTNPISAHHSPASYDLTTEVVVSGVVVDYEWANPHVYISVMPDAAAAGPIWLVEANAPSAMRRRGWSDASLAVGDFVSLTGNPGRDGRSIMRLRELSINDGAVLVNRELVFDAVPVTIGPAADLEGTWVSDGVGTAWQRFTSAASLRLTARGRAALEGYDERTDSNVIDCIPYSVPMMMLLPDVKSIEFDGDVMRIRGEIDNTVRTIHMNPVSTSVPSYLGHSIGRWEDDAFVIETTEYLPHSQGIATRLASSSEKRTIERLELDPDGLSFTYSVTVEDPLQLEEPVSGEMIFRHRPDLEFVGVECELANARRFLETEPAQGLD